MPRKMKSTPNGLPATGKAGIQPGSTPKPGISMTWSTLYRCFYLLQATSRKTDIKTEISIPPIVIPSYFTNYILNTM